MSAQRPVQLRAAVRMRPPGALRPERAPGRVLLRRGSRSSIAAAVAAVFAHAPSGGWGSLARVHLLFVGGVSQLVLGAGQFFACAFLATDPPEAGCSRSSSPPGTAGRSLWQSASHRGRALPDRGRRAAGRRPPLWVGRASRYAAAVIPDRAGHCAGTRPVAGFLGVGALWGSCWPSVLLVAGQPAGRPHGAEPGRLVRHGDRRHAAHLLPLAHPDAARFTRGCSCPPSRSGWPASPPLASARVRHPTTGRLGPLALLRIVAAPGANLLRRCAPPAPR